MTFAVFGYQPLLDTFNIYLQAFEGTSRFYDPLWMSLYVFLPVNTITNFYRNYYLSDVFKQKFSPNMQGKAAPGKFKLFSIVQNVLLQELFSAIIRFANRNKFNHIESFIEFTFAQNLNFKNWASSIEEKKIGLHKTIWK
jgi:hypothetical protein